MRLIEGIVMVAIGPTAVERDVACLGGVVAGLCSCATGGGGLIRGARAV